MKSFNLSEWALQHGSLVTYFMLMIVVAGVADYFKLGRSEDPDFTVKTMVAAASWPGATVEDTLEQITDRLERKLQETPSLDYVKSYTSAGHATIFVNLKDSTRPADVPDIWYQVRKKVRDIAGTLPRGVVGPDFDDEFGDTYGIVYGFTANGLTDRELHDYVHEVRKQLLELPDISKIDILGAQDERVYVEFSHEKLAGLGIDRSALINALESQNAVTPAGVVQTNDEKILVRVSGAFRSEQDVLGINFVAGGRMIRLGDIARVTRGSTDPATPMFRVNGQQGIGLAIAMRKGGDVMALGHNVAEAMARITENLPVGIEPTLVANQTVIVEHAVDEFMEALWEAIAIVLGVSLLSLGLRAGAVVALSIPLVLAVVFTVMSFTGIDLQRISLGALIIALGLLVDDAMITVESMVTRLERGDDKEQAATFAYTSTAFPMLTGTLVTVAGFVPIGFARSAAGEYTFSIFAVVAIALLASWVVAVLFSPLLGVWILKKPKAAHSEEPGPILRTFRRFLELAMRWRWITLLVTLGLCALSLLGMRFVPQQFFPSSDRPELLVQLQLPENASIYATRDVSARFDALLKGDSDVDHWSTYVGRGAVRFYLPLNVQLPNDFFAQAVVVTKGLEERERVKTKLERTLANAFASVIARVFPLELGPPVGWPLQYRVSGPRPAEVRDIAFKVAEILGGDPDAGNVHYDWMEPARTVRIRVDQDEARLLGLSSQDLAQSLNTVVSGVTATELRSGIHLVDVVVRASAEQRMSLSTLRTLQVPLPNGKTVPLGQIASVEYDHEYPIVWRRDRRPTVTVQGDVVRRASRDGRAGRGAEDRSTERAPAVRLPDRRRRHGRGQRQGASIGRGRYAFDVGPYAHDADDPAPAVQWPVLGAERGPARPHRSRCGSAAGGQASGLRGAAGCAGAHRHDRAQFGDPDRPDREGEGTWTRCLGSRRGGHDAPFPPDPAHRCSGDSRHDSHRTDHLLGPHGLRDHGWPGGRDPAHPRLPAGALRHLVPHREPASGHRAESGSRAGHLGRHLTGDAGRDEPWAPPLPGARPIRGRVMTHLSARFRYLAINSDPRGRLR
jgi:multidrug efflux pump subunit AcrB